MRKFMTGALMVLAMATFSSCGMINDWSRNQRILDAKAAGEAALIESEGSKKVIIETAKANYESAKMNADADIIRAKGIAEANHIIGESLNGNRAYLEWLWIDNMNKNENAVFYVPTENKIPLMQQAQSVSKRVYVQPAQQE